MPPCEPQEEPASSPEGADTPRKCPPPGIPPHFMFGRFFVSRFWSDRFLALAVVLSSVTLLIGFLFPAFDVATHTCLVSLVMAT